MRNSNLVANEKLAPHILDDMREYASDIIVGLCGQKPKHQTTVNGSGSFVCIHERYGG